MRKLPFYLFAAVFAAGSLTSTAYGMTAGTCNIPGGNAIVIGGNSMNDLRNVFGQMQGRQGGACSGNWFSGNGDGIRLGGLSFGNGNCKSNSFLGNGNYGNNWSSGNSDCGNGWFSGNENCGSDWSFGTGNCGNDWSFGNGNCGNDWSSGNGSCIIGGDQQPDIPEGSDKPDAPDVPGGLDKPGVPDVPNGSDKPDVPDVPGGSDKPDVPNKPNVPDVEMPGQPGNGSIQDAYAAQVVELVNQERAKAGLSALKIHTGAESAAMVRAKELERNFSHTRPDGSDFYTVLKAAGISYQSAGENIAYGQTSPQQVMNAWMNSSGHKANILSGSYTSIGVAHYQNGAGVDYWVQLFLK